jgi:hypothetical protein
LFGNRSLYNKIMSRESIFIIAVLMIAFGSWMNAQGGWVKDFAFSKTVELPFLFKDYYTSGFNWYMVGIVDDLVGFALNIAGFIILRRSGLFSRFARFGKNAFILPLAVYLFLDAVAFLNFTVYYSGMRNISTYGIYWNIIQYFGMLPAFFATDLAILTSAK